MYIRICLELLPSKHHGESSGRWQSVNEAVENAEPQSGSLDTDLNQSNMDIIFHMSISLVNIPLDKITKFTTELDSCWTTSHNNTVQEPLLLCFRNACPNKKQTSHVYRELTCQSILISLHL